jgi:hypothetical protein
MSKAEATLAGWALWTGLVAAVSVALRGRRDG